MHKSRFFFVLFYHTLQNLLFELLNMYKIVISWIDFCNFVGVK